MPLYDFGHGIVTIENEDELNNMKSLLDHLYNSDVLTLEEYKEGMDKLSNIDDYLIGDSKPSIHRDIIEDYDRAMKGVI